MRLSLVIVSAILLSACCRQKITVSVENQLNLERNSEIVEIDADNVTSRFGSDFVIHNSENQEVAYQLTHDGKLIFPTAVAPESVSKYFITAGKPQTVDTIAVGIYRPDCQDDFAWENEHSGYRLYGPIFRQGGGKVYGYDIWTKSVAYPILTKFYDDDHKRGISYHVDHGCGFDGYTVGPTLGAGMNALVDRKGEICYPCAYNKFELLDNGPLRMTVKFTIDTIAVDNSPVVETRIVTLDAGAWLNRTTTNYNGLNDQHPVVAGIAIHSDNHNYVVNRELSYISYADQTDNITAGNGEIFVGVLADKVDKISYQPFNETVANAVGQLLLYNTYQPGESYTYYWGSGWTKGGVASIDAWNKILETEKAKISSPLKVTLK
jgi:hypothetical protein